MADGCVDSIAVCLAEDLDAAWADVETLAGQGAETRVIACRWERVPRLDALLDDVVKTFAGVALADWPHWHGTALVDPRSPADFDQTLGLRQAAAEICRNQPKVVGSWLRWAAGECLSGRLPFDDAAPREFQTGQLGGAISPGKLLIVLSARSPEQGGAATVTAAAEWLGRIGVGGVTLLLPVAWESCEALRRLNLVPRRLANATTAPPTQGAHDGVKIQVTPLAGLPHPGSAAEQALYKRIGFDQELAACLKFNQTIEVDLHQKYRVDIACAALRVAIEIDGDDHRASVVKYTQDCQRDYRLMLQGYLVLRLPNDIVENDMELAIQRIRDLIRYRKQLMHNEVRP